MLGQLKSIAAISAFFSAQEIEHQHKLMRFYYFPEGLFWRK